MRKTLIIPNLWYDSQAEEAARYYVSIFKDGKIGNITYFTEVGFEHHQRPAGSVMTVEFELLGQKFLALNGGPVFRFTEAVSFIVPCDDQQEIDYYWDHLSAGGDKAAQQCGWLKDKYGLSWQVVPSQINEWMRDPEKSRRVMERLLQMKKIDLAALESA